MTQQFRRLTRGLVVAAFLAIGCGQPKQGVEERESATTNFPELERNVTEVKTENETEEPQRTGFASHVTVEAFLDREDVRPGESFRVAVVLLVDDGWYIYGNPLGPGIGQPTVISVDAHSPEDRVPLGAASEIAWDPVRYSPAMKHEQDLGDSNPTWIWEHTGRSVHFLAGRLGENAMSDSVRLVVHVKGQVCNPESCLPGTLQTELTFPIADVKTENRLANAELFREFEKSRRAISPAPAPGLDD